jgi:hypothetical protein
MLVCRRKKYIRSEYSRHAALYVLENGTSLHWRKLGVEGFFYVVKRYEFFRHEPSSRSDSVPKYRWLLKNQTDSGEGDFVQTIDDNIRFEIKEGTFFYQYAKSSKYRFPFNL